MAANCHHTRKYYATLRNAPSGITQGCIIFPCVMTICSHLYVHPKLGIYSSVSRPSLPREGLACETIPASPARTAWDMSEILVLLLHSLLVLTHRLPCCCSSRSTEKRACSLSEEKWRGQTSRERVTRTP